jgi:tRNA modification GTPase
LYGLSGRRLAPRKASLVRLAPPGSREQTIDRCLALWFPGPSSFTGEDVVEFHIHGGRAVSEAILHVAASEFEIRLAEPGEFSLRAFKNGKMDLAEAEAIASLIDSETEHQRRLAIRVLEGEFSKGIGEIRGAILEARALVEAGLDFADEDDVHEGLELYARPLIAAAQAEIAALIKGAGGRRQIVEGFKIVIAGPVNAGKSSLFNALAKRDLAITSAIPGTTRDSLEVRLDIGGYLVVVVDTAGIRAADDPIEEAGIARARAHLETADLVLWLSEQGVPVDSGVEESRVLRVRTKCDLETSVGGGIPVSVLVPGGLELLLQEVGMYLNRIGSSYPAPVIRERHLQALMAAGYSLECAQSETCSGRTEVLAEHLRRASDELGRIVGVVGSEELLGEIFGKFCIGK